MGIDPLYLGERNAKRRPPNKTARCEACHKQLRYEVGSLVWQHTKRDLCPEHRAEESVKKAMSV